MGPTTTCSTSTFECSFIFIFFIFLPLVCCTSKIDLRVCTKIGMCVGVYEKWYEKWYLNDDTKLVRYRFHSWWCHQMETFSALLAICARNSPVTGEFPSQRPVTRSFDVFYDLRMNKRLSKQRWGWWFETPSRPLWRHCNDSRSYLWSFV